MDYKPKPIESAINYLREGYNNIAQTVNKLLSPNPSRLELAVGYAGIPNVLPDRLQADIKDITQNYHPFAASNIRDYEHKGRGQVTVRRSSDGKIVTLNGQNAKGAIEDYVRQVLSNDGYKPNSSEINKISATIKKGMQSAGIAIKVRKC